MHIALRAEGYVRSSPRLVYAESLPCPSHGHSEDGHLSSSWEIAVVVSLREPDLLYSRRR